MAISSLLKEQRSRTGQKTEGAGALLSYTKSFSHTRLAKSRAWLLTEPRGTPKSNSISANVGEENNETLKMQQEHSHKMAHASMPSAKTKLKMFLKNETTEQKRKNKKERNQRKKNSVSNK